MENREREAYRIIEQEAGSNASMQGLSGLLGFPFTALADIGAVFTYYEPMWKQIRHIYGRSETGTAAVLPIIKGCLSEIFSDLVLDKLIGQIPLVGIGTNILCAKAMTWRLGLLFTMLSARGDAIDEADAKACAGLIRRCFPQTDSLRFKAPPFPVFTALAAGRAEPLSEIPLPLADDPETPS